MTKQFLPVGVGKIYCLMPVKDKLLNDIKEAKFVEALVGNGGVVGEAYKAIRPQVTDASARALGSKELSKVNRNDINTLYEQIGCTKIEVLSGLWKRMQATRNDSVYIKGTNTLAKIGGWEERKDHLKDLLDSGLDLVEIVKVRLAKSKDSKELQKPIDVSYTSKDNLDTNANSDGTATENGK